MKPTDDNKINTLHKELRRRFYQAGLQAQMMNEDNKGGVKEFLNGLTGLAGFSAFVALEEEKNLFPEIISAAPFMIPLFDQEHEQIKQLGEKICVLADDFEDAYTNNERMKILRLIISSFNEWMGKMLQHLFREEMIIEQAFTFETEAPRDLSLVAA